eukprot:scaffold105418_cov30-Tisochrysis_lutea.AAC.4
MTRAPIARTVALVLGGLTHSTNEPCVGESCLAARPIAPPGSSVTNATTPKRSSPSVGGAAPADGVAPSRRAIAPVGGRTPLLPSVVR